MDIVILLSLPRVYDDLELTFVSARLGVNVLLALRPGDYRVSGPASVDTPYQIWV